MIIPDHKKAMATVIGRRSPRGEQIAAPAPMNEESVKDESGEPDGRHAAAQDMISAFHEKSPERLMQSLANFMDLHNMKSEASEK